MKLIFTLAALVGLLASPIVADQCQRARVVVRSQQRHAVYVPIQRYYAVQPIYQVGSALREEAIAQRAAQLALESLVQQLQSDPGNVSPDRSPVQPDGPVEPIAGDARAQEIFQQHCVRCHAGASPRGGLDLSDVRQVDTQMRMKAAVFAFRGVMPPEGGAISSDEDATFLLDWASGISQ